MRTKTKSRFIFLFLVTAAFVGGLFTGKTAYPNVCEEWEKGAESTAILIAPQQQGQTADWWLARFRTQHFYIDTHHVHQMEPERCFYELRP